LRNIAAPNVGTSRPISSRADAEQDLLRRQFFAVCERFREGAEFVKMVTGGRGGAWHDGIKGGFRVDLSGFSFASSQTMPEGCATLQRARCASDASLRNGACRCQAAQMTRKPAAGYHTSPPRFKL
jgi:hypothetical protein